MAKRKNIHMLRHEFKIDSNISRSQRDREIINLYNYGFGISVVGQMYQISKQRVWQILQENNVSIRN